MPHSTIGVWDTCQAERTRWSVSTCRELADVALSTDGRRLYVGTADSTITRDLRGRKRTGAHVVGEYPRRCDRDRPEWHARGRQRTARMSSCSTPPPSPRAMTLARARRVSVSTSFLPRWRAPRLDVSTTVTSSCGRSRPARAAGAPRRTRGSRRRRSTSAPTARPCTPPRPTERSSSGISPATGASSHVNGERRARPRRRRGRGKSVRHDRRVLQQPYRLTIQAPQCASVSRPRDRTTHQRDRHPVSSAVDRRPVAGAAHRAFSSLRRSTA